MSDYNLIKQLQNPETDVKMSLPKGIKYEQFTVMTENKEVVVHIPSREKENFEQILAENSNFSKNEFSTLLRRVRGVRG